MPHAVKVCEYRVYVNVSIRADATSPAAAGENRSDSSNAVSKAEDTECYPLFEDFLVGDRTFS